MEGNYPSSDNILMPIIPIPLDPGLRVITINEQKIDLFKPLLYSLEAEFVYPSYAPIVNFVYCAVCHPFYGVKTLEATKVEWVNQPKLSLGRHYLTERNGRGALGNSDLDHAPPAIGPFP